MVAHMNEEARRKTIESGEAWYYSRSRKALWKKGESSGHVQRVVELRVDCDQDALWLKVEQAGPGACHTGRRSCFYRAVPLGKAGSVTLEFRNADKTFDPHVGLWRGGRQAAPLSGQFRFCCAKIACRLMNVRYCWLAAAGFVWVRQRQLRSGHGGVSASCW